MVRLFKHYIPHAVLILGLVDFLLLWISADLAWILRADQINMETGDLVERLLPLGSFAFTTQAAMVSVGVYGADALRSMRFACARMLVAVSLAILGLVLIDFLLPGHTYWRSTLLYSMVFSIGLLILNRLLLGVILDTSAFRRRVLVLGAGPRAKRLQALSELPGSGFTIVSYVVMSEGLEDTIGGAIDRSEIPDLTKFASKLGASEVVLAIEERRKALPLKDLLRIKTTGVHVNEFSTFIERETGRVDLDTLNPSWLIFSDGFSAGHVLSSIVKRCFDIIASCLFLALTFPIIAIFAVLVKLDSKGPVFFRQQRVGLDGKKFIILKLRSMTVDAEKDGAKWAQINDVRITRVGRIIRKIRVDELPQIWTVLKGNMSFVGPRPEVPKFVTELEEQLPYYAERHMVKPGITGWAQINYPYGASVEDARAKLEYDLYYAKNYTTFLDILILLQTLRVVLWSEGAR